MEDEVRRIWLDVLNLESVGRDEDFFDLGGHSVLMETIRRRIRDDLGVRIPMRTLLGNPTIAAMARYIEDHRKT